MWLERVLCHSPQVSRLCRRLQSSLSVSSVIKALEGRGLVSQCTRVESESVPHGSSVYVGFDPTADSLHTGNLIAILALIHFRQAGYQPIAVIGGATGRVGDPSGRSTERDKLSQETLNKNLEGISNDLKRIFHNVEDCLPQNTDRPELLVLDNAEWWDDVNGVHFVSDIARHFRLTSMLNKESVKQRLHSDEGMNCAEFLYPIFQAYDFLHLNKHYNCRLQLGGGDQWGNITAGCEFVRKATGNIVHGLTLPLLTSPSGEKLSKSTGNAVWLSPDKTSPFEFYQKFVQISDQVVEDWLKYFSFLSMKEMKDVLKEHRESPSRFVAQKCLAEQITKLVHGEEGLQQALNATLVLFGGGGIDTLKKLSAKDFEKLFHDAPTTELPLSSLRHGGMTLVELAMKSGAADSQWHAESLVKRGGLYVNLVRVTSPEERVDQTIHLLAGNITLLRIGKKTYTLVKWR